MSSSMTLSVLLRAVDNISNPVRMVQGRLGAFRREAQAISRQVGFDFLAGSLRRSVSAASELYGVTRRLARRMSMFGLAAGAALGLAVNSTASLGDQTAKTADMLGIHVERLQELRYAAERAGMSQGNFDMALRRMLRRTAEAAQGSGAAKAELEELGLSAEALQQKLPEEALGIVADALGRVENQSDKLRIAFKLFDTDGAAMLNMLRDGSAGLERMSQRARELGYVISDDTARAAERFQDQMLDMRKSILGVRTIMGSELMPIFGQWMEQLTTLVVRYQPQIREFAQRFAADLPGRVERLRQEFTVLVERATPLITLGSRLVARFGALSVVATVLGVVLAAPLLIPMIKLGFALGSVAVALLNLGAGMGVLALKAIPLLVGAFKGVILAFTAANPIAMVITAIAVGAALLLTNWSAVEGFFRGLWGSVTGYFSAAHQELVQWLGFDPLELLRPLWEPVGGFIGGLWGRGKEAVAEGIGGIASLIMEFHPATLLRSAFDSTLAYLDSLDFTEHGRRMLSTLTDGIRSMAMAPVDAVRDSLGRVRNLLPFSDAKEGPLSRLTASGRAIPETLAEGAQAGSGVLQRTVELVLGALPTVPDLIGQVKYQAQVDTPPDADRPRAEGAQAGSGVLQRTVELVLGALPTVPDLIGQVKYQAQVDTPPDADRPRAEGAQAGSGVLQRTVELVLGALPTVPDLIGQVKYQAQVDTPPDADRPRAEGAQAALTARGADGRAVHIGHIDFRPQVHVQVGDQASAQDVAAILQEYLERWRNTDLWEQIQGAQEELA